MYDCVFTKENHRFRYRAGGILLCDDKMLFVKSGVGDYYYMIGGGVHLGETSAECIERELFEETGIQAHAEHLAVVCENFFKGVGGVIDGFDCHYLEFYFYMKSTGDAMNVCRDMTDTGEKLIWLPIDEIEQNEIKPSFIKKHIKEIIGEEKTLHIIQETDR
ncbi:MAG: NUDIX hydrolase [Oscillospiraceae bacterium]